MFRWLLIATRLALGAAFVYAGAIKIQDPAEFAITIASFDILPNLLISPLALMLPPLEIIAGALLIIGWGRRPASLALVLLLTIFVIAIVAALARGLTIDCGCFGTGTPTRARMWLDLGRDLLLLGAALIVYRFADYSARSRYRTLM